MCSLRQCEHPNVVRYHSSYVQDGQLWIAMECCLVSTQGVMRSCLQPLQEDEIAVVCAEALRGLHYLHTERRLIHRDVKVRTLCPPITGPSGRDEHAVSARALTVSALRAHLFTRCAADVSAAQAGNILLTERGEVKLADFGVAAQMSGTLAKRSTVIGTPMWMSPEMIEAGSYDHRTDIWSLGITALELAQLNPPHFEVSPPVRVLFLIPQLPPPTLEKPELWSSAFLRFVERCLVKEPTERLDAAAALQEPFICGTDCSPTGAVPAMLRRHAGRTASGERRATGAVDLPDAAPATLSGSLQATLRAGDDRAQALAGGTVWYGTASYAGSTSALGPSGSSNEGTILVGRPGTINGSLADTDATLPMGFSADATLPMGLSPAAVQGYCQEVAHVGDGRLTRAQMALADRGDGGTLLQGGDGGTLLSALQPSTLSSAFPPALKQMGSSSGLTFMEDYDTDGPVDDEGRGPHSPSAPDLATLSLLPPTPVAVSDSPSHLPRIPTAHEPSDHAASLPTPPAAITPPASTRVRRKQTERL